MTLYRDITSSDLSSVLLFLPCLIASFLPVHPCNGTAAAAATAIAIAIAALTYLIEMLGTVASTFSGNMLVHRQPDPCLFLR